MIIAFDLDDVICTRPKNLENLGIEKYNSCEPVPEMVDVVNKCYEEGNYIKIYTARGMSQLNGNVSAVYNKLFETTSKQLKNWGVKYHELVMGKIHYDILIDDKVMNSLDVKSYGDIKTFVSRINGEI